MSEGQPPATSLKPDRTDNSLSVAPAATAMPKKEVLVIDDEENMRLVICHALRQAGFAPAAVASAEEGLAMAEAHPPNLILSDIMMGDGEDGFRLLARLRQHPATATIPVILMTGDADLASEAGVRQGMELGADDFLRKPFTKEKLLAAVEARLRKQGLIQVQAERTRACLHQILEATIDVVAIVQARSRQVLYLNHAGRKLFGLAQAQDLGELTLDRLHSPAAAVKLLAESIPTATGQGVWQGEMIFLGPAGGEVPVREVILAHKTDKGEADLFSVVAQDISEPKKAEAARRLLEVQLRQAQKLESIGQLAAGIAHEINTPIQFVGDNTRFVQDALQHFQKSILEFRQMLESARATALTAEMIQQAEDDLKAADMDYLLRELPTAVSESLDGIERITRIVRAMKEFSHPSSKDRAPINLNHAIESTVTVARNEWKYVAEMALELDPTLPPVRCFASEINQVVLNLVVNAAHAIADVVRQKPGAKGLITIRTRRLDDWAEIQVADTGTGIPEAIRERIYDPFYTTKDVGKGTGQGLTIAHDTVVNRHGGSIHFQTEMGRGTTFFVHLPLNSKTNGPHLLPEETR